MKDLVVSFFKDEEGLETIEMVILLVIVVGIAFVFRKALVTWFNQFLGDVQKQGPDPGTITPVTEIGK